MTQEPRQSKIGQLFSLLMKELRDLFNELTHLRDTTDIAKTIENIRKGIVIKGYNVWILACGAMLASIGLDQDSTAVIIGAMLISPLMSPILGIGLSLGINDREHLYLSFKNFLIAVVATLLVSAFYFKITPLGSVTEQISLRTEPTFLDVLVAIFGGIAGIVAISRKEITNAIPGVAIATALMPPLCVAGFGIAKGNWDFFLGAFYLFFINSVFIALATLLIVRYLRFPFKEFLDDSLRRRATAYGTIFILLLIVPSFMFLVNSIRDLNRSSRIDTYISNVVNTHRHRVTDRQYVKGDTLNELTLAIAGPPYSQDSIQMLEDSLANYELKNTRLILLQSPESVDGDELVNRFQLEALSAIQPQINQLQAQIDSLGLIAQAIEADTLAFNQISGEVHQLFPSVTQFSISEAIETNFDGQQDSLTLLVLAWKKNVRTSQRRREGERIRNWLQDRLKKDSVKLITLPY